MKGKQRIKLLRSQKILLQMKNEKIQEAINIANARHNELQATLNLTMTEQGVPKNELNQWKLTEDGQAIEKTEMPEPEKPDDGKKGKKDKKKGKKGK